MQDLRLTIAAIEDDPGDVELIRRCLEGISDWSIELLAFPDSESARAEMARRQVDVVLADYMLGTETGIDIINKLRRAHDDHPVVILTGYGSEEVAAEAMRAGAMDYLPKRVLSANSLRRAIFNAVEKHALRRSVDEHQRRIEEIAVDLTRKNEEITQFYHTVSHELKTPLASAREFVSIVLDGIGGPVTDEQREYLGIAVDSCNQMVTCINDLLDATRLETGKVAIVSRRAQMGDLICAVVTRTSRVAEERGVRLQYETEPDLPDVLIDETRITQVLDNLVNNALKFTRAGGEVVLRARRDQDRAGFVVVSVSDTGRGIPNDKLDRIFDRLVQVDRSDAGSRGGLGLGLSICRELVLLHGGEIWVESEPGRGSTFSFSVPEATETVDHGAGAEREEMAQ